MAYFLLKLALKTFPKGEFFVFHQIMSSEFRDRSGFKESPGNFFAGIFERGRERTRQMTSSFSDPKIRHAIRIGISATSISENPLYGILVGINTYRNLKR